MVLGFCCVTVLSATQPLPFRSWPTLSPRQSLGSLRLLVFGDFNVHAGAETTGPALEFLETMASLNMSQHVIGPTHVGGHTLDLVFTTTWNERDLMVTDLVSVPLSWSDHHLIKCNLSVALPPRREQGPISMVHPRRLLDPAGFQDAMRGVTLTWLAPLSRLWLTAGPSLPLEL